MSQFAFLAAEFHAVHEHAARAENLAYGDPRAACFYARLALEVMVQWLYRHDSSLRDPYSTTLAALIHEPTFQTLVGSSLVAKARIVKDLGNAAVHEAKAVPSGKAVTALRELFHLSYWLARTYGRSAHPDATLTFSPNALPRTSSIAVAKLTQLQEIARRFADTVKARDEAERQRLASEAEREKLDAEIKALQAGGGR
jgi:type I restriction enzyme R subunit